jgi:RNA polymerase sigma-70 factor, ECF subfamily
VIAKKNDRIVPYLKRLFRYAWALTRTDEAAEDLVQEAARKALAARRTPEDESAYRAWLFTILRNQHRDDLRRLNVVEKYISQNDEDGAEYMEYWPEDERLINKIAVKRALAAMSEKHAEILMLIDMAGFSYREAAKILDVPTGTVMSRLNRARAAMMKVLESDSGNVVDLSVRRKQRG